MSDFNFDLLINAAEELGYEYDADALNTMREVYQAGEYYVAFIGQFSSGKSSLINNILERDVLPQGSLETTPLMTYIKYGEQEKAIVYYMDGRSEDIKLDEIKQIVQKGEKKQRNLEDLEHIEVFVKNVMLENGMILLDTPGINTLIEKHEKLLSKTLKLATKIIYVSGKAPTLVDIEKITVMKERGMDVAFVRTHCDDIKDFEESKETVINNDVKTLEASNIFTNEIFHVSNHKNSEWFNQISVLRNMLLVTGKNIKTMRETSFATQLTYFKEKFSKELEQKKEQLIAQKEHDTNKLDQQKKEFEIKIKTLEVSCETEQQRINRQIEKDVNELKKSFGDVFEKNLESAKNKIVNTNQVTNVNDLQVLLYKLQREVMIQTLTQMNSQINPMLEMINGSIVFDTEYCSQLEIPEMESIDEIIASRKEELCELENHLINVQKNRDQLSKQLALDTDSKEVKELEAELKSLAEQIKSLQAEKDELGIYIPQMVEVLDNGIKPSDIGKTIGNIADWALLVIPGLGEGAAAAKAGKVASTAAKAGKAVSAASKANKVTKTLAKVIGTAEKAGKIISKGKTAGDVASGLKNMGKVYATTRRIEAAQNIVKTASKFAAQAKKDGPECIMDYLTLEHWGKTIGSCFDSPPKYEEDKEVKLTYQQESERLKKELMEIHKVNYEKLCKMGVYKTRLEKEKARMQGLLKVEQDLQSELKKKKKELRVQAQRSAKKKWLENCQNEFEVKTRELLCPLIDEYLSSIPNHLEDYFDRRLFAQREIIKRENAKFESILHIEPESINERIEIIKSLLDKIKGIDNGEGVI